MSDHTDEREIQLLQTTRASLVSYIACLGVSDVTIIKPDEKF